MGRGQKLACIAWGEKNESMQGTLGGKEERLFPVLSSPAHPLFLFFLGFLGGVFPSTEEASAEERADTYKGTSLNFFVTFSVVLECI